MVVALSTSTPRYVYLYSHAKELADYLKKHMELDVVARYYSDAMPPEVFVDGDGTAGLKKVEFYSFKNRDDLILLAGDCSPSSQNFEFSEAVLRYAQELGVKEVYSIGTRWAEPPAPTVNPQVQGYATDAVGVERLSQAGVTIIRDEYSPYFSGVVVGVAKLLGLRGYRLSVNHGEPKPHPRSAASLLRALSKMLELNIDPTDLDEYASRLEEQQIPPTDAEYLPRREDSGIYR